MNRLAEIFTVKITNMTHKLLPRLGVYLEYRKLRNIENLFVESG